MWCCIRNDVLILLAALIFLVWYYFKNAFKKFKNNNVPYVEPSIPFGNLTKSSLQIEHFTEDLDTVYKRFSDHKYIGLFQMTTPVVLICGPDAIKQVAVKDFDHFLNHQAFVNEDLDPLFGRSLFSLKDTKWKHMRSTLSPAFTSSKMKNMFTFMSDCGIQVCNYLNAEIERSPKDGGKKFVSVELKDLCTRYTSDVIATTVYGVKVDSLRDKENQFYTTGLKATNLDGLSTMLKFYGYSLFPKLMAALNMRIFADETNNFYRTLVHDTMQYREKEKIYRPDMIHLLMEARKGTLKHDEQSNTGNVSFAAVEEASVNISSNNTKWSDDDLTAQTVLFLLAGLDTTADLMCFMLHELALNTDIQRRLQDEIDALIAANGEVLSYDSVHKLIYLDMVVSETLRKWPPATINDRACTKEYNLGPSKDGASNNIKLRPEDLIWIPVYSIHRDPKYWPNPEKFDPERFSEENRKSIIPYTYLPFGVGPRNCIGSRHALVETKVLMYYLLSKFNVEVNSKTPIPLILLPTSFNLKPKGGFSVDFVPRNT